MRLLPAVIPRSISPKKTSPGENRTETSHDTEPPMAEWRAVVKLAGARKNDVRLSEGERESWPIGERSPTFRIRIKSALGEDCGSWRTRSTSDYRCVVCRGNPDELAPWWQSPRSLRSRGPRMGRWLKRRGTRHAFQNYDSR